VKNLNEPEYDSTMQASAADISIIQPIIDQIRAGQTKQALEKIEVFDKSVLDKIVVIKVRQCDSILKAAIENDALEIINKLIEKKCNLIERRFENPRASMDNALDLWFKKVIQLESKDVLPVAISIGQTLLKEIQKTIFNDDFYDLKLQGIINTNWQRSNDNPMILFSLLGKGEFINFLFQPALKYPICTLYTADAFEECLKILLQDGGKITEEQMFILELALFSASLNVDQKESDKFIQKMDNHWKALVERMTSGKTKPLIGIDKSLLMPQTISPMNDFPEAEYWRLFVDGKKQANSSENGWAGYEKMEPGCIQNMYDAFVYARKNVETEQLTYEMTDEIHRIATGHFKELASTEFRAGMTTSAIAAFDALSYKGYFETTKAPYNKWYKIRHENRSEPTVLFANFADGQYNSQEKIIEKVKEIVQDYHKNFVACGDDRAKQLQCIIKLVSDYARFHPYRDGNNRTAVCVLNRELQKHGFSLCILSNPNELEGHSQAELFTKVCKGMQDFLAVKAGLPYPGSKTTDEFIKENGTSPPIKLAESAAKIKFKG
jgi:hypothetical protein